MLESSDEDDKDSSNSVLDSAQAEKVFSYRNSSKCTSSLNARTNKAEKSLFRVSDTSDSESSQR